MIGRAKTATKFFVYGLIVGIFFAPRSGEETRAQIFGWLGDAAKNILGGGGGESNA